MSELAAMGGNPVRGGRPWPAWPVFDGDTERVLLDTLRSARWTVSWPSRGRAAVEREFAERFAAYHDVPYCVAVDHGSSALVLALEGLDVGPGDEVLVPAMTWVATASAVLRVGALPVLVDVDPQTGCLTPDAVRAALTGRTRAVIVVHLACTTADLDGIVEVTRGAGIWLVEDCAQAHGARWRDRHVGTYGVIGAFSFQQGKALAAGEGGAVITGDERLYRRFQQLRADSRVYAAARAGQMEVVELGEVIGANHCMSDLHAAILLDQLPRLDAQHEYRESMVDELARQLKEIGDFGAIPVPVGCTRRSIYEYGIRFEPEVFGGASVGQVAQALSAELQRPVYPPDTPLHRSRLFRPETKRRFAAVWTPEGRDRSIGRAYPGAEAYRDTTVLFHHSTLLAAAPDMADVAAALEKARRHRHDVARLPV